MISIHKFSLKLNEKHWHTFNFKQYLYQYQYISSLKLNQSMNHSLGYYYKHKFSLKLWATTSLYLCINSVWNWTKYNSWYLCPYQYIYRYIHMHKFSFKLCINFSFKLNIIHVMIFISMSISIYIWFQTDITYNIL